MSDLLSFLTLTDLIGTLAGILSTLAFLPQAVQVWRTQSTKDLSMGMYVLYTSGLVFWSIYGFMLDSWPLILTEGFTLILSLYIVWMKLRMDRRSFSSKNIKEFYKQEG
jgi:MtN3 and saliva related transmembrane protein